MPYITSVNRMDDFRWAIIIHRLDKFVIFMMIDDYDRALDFTEARRHKKWRDAIRNASDPVNVEIIEAGDDLQAARDLFRTIATRLNPLVSAYKSRTSLGHVRCRDTGELYPNASQAAEANNIHRSAMSNHLNRRPGYETIHGLRFERVMPDQLMEEAKR